METNNPGDQQQIAEQLEKHTKQLDELGRWRRSVDLRLTQQTTTVVIHENRLTELDETMDKWFTKMRELQEINQKQIELNQKQISATQKQLEQLSTTVNNYIRALGNGKGGN